MKLIYVAGPFSAPHGTPEDEKRDFVEFNIRRAEEVGLEVAAAGGFPVVPHSNTSHELYETLQPYQFWIEGTLELLKRCDALVTVPGWKRSSGALGEVAWARENGKPAFMSIDDLREWLSKQ